MTTIKKRQPVLVSKALSLTLSSIAIATASFVLLTTEATADSKTAQNQVSNESDGKWSRVASQMDGSILIAQTDPATEGKKAPVPDPSGVPQASSQNGTVGDHASSLKGQATQTQEAAARPNSEQFLKSAASLIGKYRGSWSMFLQNPSHTANVSLDKPFTLQGKMLWRFPAEGPIDSSPAIYMGVVYVGSDDTYLYALDERNGRMLWRVQLGDKVKSSPAVSNGIVVVGCEDKKVYGIDAKRGKVLWSYETADRVSASPTVDDGVVYVGGWDGYLHALDLKTGTPKWKFPNAGPGLGRITAACAMGPGVLFVSTHSGLVCAVHSTDGALIWQFKTGSKVYSPPLLMDGTLFFGGWDKQFYALDALTGRVKWKYTAAESFSIAPVGANGRVFIGNDDLKMYCFDAATGKLYWKTQFNSPVPLLASSPALVGGMLYCGSSDTNLYAVDVRNGLIKWKYKTQRPVISSPAVSSFGVCVGSQDGNLYMIN